MKASWSDAEIRMALRIMAYDGARNPETTRRVIDAFAERCDDPGEQAAWQAIVARLDADPRQSEALWALRGF